jgi:hypothetical protein
VTPMPAPPATAGAMSPLPVTVNVPAPAPALKPSVPAGRPSFPPPTFRPTHAPPRQVRPTWSKTPVAALGPPLMLASLAEVCR